MNKRKMNKYILLFTILAFASPILKAQSKAKPPITPRWAFEHIVWEDGVNTQDAAEKLVRLYQEHDMPVGGIIIDSPWSTAYNNFDWNKERYPNSDQMIQDFKKENVKVVLWLTGCINSTAVDMPIQKHPAYDEIVEKGYAVNNGKDSHWWKGDGLHLDFTNPAAVKWWNAQLDKAVVDGVSGFKVDQGEVYYGDTVQTSIGAMTNEEFRPYYYDNMYDYITNKKTEGAIIGRPYSHQKGVAASIEKLSMGWCGDFEGSWEGLKLQVNNIYKSAERGYGAPACEVGGFWKAKSSKNELIRYAQFGAFTASMINGGENGAFTNHLPWYHDDETTECYRQAVWLHSQLIPYFFSTVVRASKEGGSLIQNPSFEEESHMVGNYIFTKAITSENNEVSFTLPKEGKWVDFWTKKVYAGGTKITQTYSYKQYPLFIKAGAIIPMNITNDYSGIGDASLEGKQTILLIGGSKKSKYKYYRPTGDGKDYEEINITFNGKKDKITVEGRHALDYEFLIWNIDDNKQEIKQSENGSSFTIKL